MGAIAMILMVCNLVATHVLYPNNCDLECVRASLVDNQMRKMTNHAVACMVPSIRAEVVVDVVVFDANDNHHLLDSLVAGNLVADCHRLRFPNRLDDLLVLDDHSALNHNLMDGSRMMNNDHSHQIGYNRNDDPEAVDDHIEDNQRVVVGICPDLNKFAKEKNISIKNKVDKIIKGDLKKPRSLSLFKVLCYLVNI